MHLIVMSSVRVTMIVVVSPGLGAAICFENQKVLYKMLFGI